MAFEPAQFLSRVRRIVWPRPFRGENVNGFFGERCRYLECYSHDWVFTKYSIYLWCHEPYNYNFLIPVEWA